MDDAEPKNDLLWGFILKVSWAGLVAYAVVLLVAFLRDVMRKTRLFSPHRKNLIYHSRLSPFTWHIYYLNIYRDTNIFYVIEFLRLAFNLAVCVVYVLGTYARNVPAYIAIVQRVMAAFFIADLASQILGAESAISSVAAIVVFADAFSFPSLIMASGPNAYLNFAFLRSIHAFTAFSRLEKRLFVKVFSSKRLFAKLGMQSIALFYSLASGIQLLEVPGDLLSVDFRNTWFNFGDWNFFNSVYFIIVTLSTVGYGDFSPSTVQGRIFTLFIIIIGIVVFTTVIGEIVENSGRGRGSGWFVKNPDTRHVIVTGNPTLTDLVLFVSEFYSDSRESNANAKIVALIEKPTWSDPDWFQYIAKNSFLQARLSFLVGSVRNPLDLQRARLNSADAVFFLTSPSSGEELSQLDTRTVMNILAVRNARTDIPVFAQTLLQDSNLQTHIALKTPTSFSKGTFFRDSKVMRKGASYQGLFDAVLKAELNDLPKAHLKRGRQCFEDVLRHYNETHDQEDAMAGEGKQADLERSRLICLQDTHMALISANIRVNGICTLLSNMYLDVQAEKPSPEDPAWLMEYHMGATCSLEYAIIPEKLNGVPIQEVALDLFHVGLVLVGTSDSRHIQMNPVLNTDKFLRRGDIGMFLTYHHQDFVTAALHLVSARHAHGELRHPLLPSVSNAEDVTREALSLDALKSMPSGAENPLGTESLDVPGHSASMGIAKTGLGLRHRRVAASSPELHVDVSGISHQSSSERFGEDILGGNLLESENTNPCERCSDGYMPDSLTGHVIVAMEGDAALANLPLFLKNLWRKDKRRSMQKARKARVVVVHPSISDDFRNKFSKYERQSLFFVNGSPASGETWKKARLSTAKSVATMADYTKPWSVSDARTIFTLLTLDVHTENDHDVFICSELVDEKSLEFLREPTHPRRRGAILGEANLRLTGSLSPPPPLLEYTAPQGVKSDARSKEPESASIPLSGGQNFSPSTTTNGIAAPSPSAAAEVSQHAVQNGVQEGVGTLTDNPGMPRPASALYSSIKSFSKNVKDVASGGSYDSLTGDRKECKNSKNPTTTLMEAQRIDGSSDATGADPMDKPGAARARRGSLFSRSRYASGELLIHSSAITLLVREYVEPGFASFYADLLGTVQPTPGLKIRLVRIPKSLFTTGQVVFRNGRALVPYNTIFKSLVRHGATPLGIYRSGTAPALIPSKNRRRRGPAILEELEPYWTAEEKDNVTSRLSLEKSFLGKLFGLVRDVAPQNLREAQGREEINGGRRSSSSSSDEDFDSDFESSNGDDEDAKKNVDGNVSQENRTDSKSTPLQDATTKMPGSRTSRERRSRASREGRKGEYSRNNLLSPRGNEMFAKLLGNGDDSFEVPGQAKYKERPVSQNLLPYVFTMPEPNTLCAEADGIYILCHPLLELSEKWTESVANKNDNESGGR